MFVLLIVLAVGLVFGSFVTCMSYRLPLEQDVVLKPSFCPCCQAKLTPKELIPLFSWLMSKGKCIHCHNPISIRYPLIELTTMAAFGAIYARYGIGLEAIILALMSVALLIMIVADLEHYIIPDEIHIALLPLGLAYHYVTGGNWDMVLAGFLVMTALGLALHYGYAKLRNKDVLGFGDVKFFAVAGVWLTLPLVAPYLFIIGVVGTLLGLVWKCFHKEAIFPFGPALAVGLFVCIVYHEVPNYFWDMINYAKNTL